MVVKGNHPQARCLGALERSILHSCDKILDRLSVDTSLTSFGGPDGVALPHVEISGNMRDSLLVACVLIIE